MQLFELMKFSFSFLSCLGLVYRKIEQLAAEINLKVLHFEL